MRSDQGIEIDDALVLSGAGRPLIVQGRSGLAASRPIKLGGNETLRHKLQHVGGQHMCRYIASSGLCIVLLSASPVLADPKCDGPESWPAAMTHAQLKNAGILVNDEVDFSRTSVQQIASQRIGKSLYRQVFKIAFHLKNGRLVQAIAVSDASKEECSMSDVTVYRIAGPSTE